MKTICDSCFEIMSHRVSGYSCPNCSDGTVHEISTYVDWTNPSVIKLSRHPDSLTLFTEKGFADRSFPLNACRVLSEDYIIENPSFVPIIPAKFKDLPIRIQDEILKDLRKKILIIKILNGWSYDLEEKMSFVMDLMFLKK